MESQTPQKPTGYENDLSDYGPVLFDGYCGQPVAWGFVIMRQLGDERFGALSQYGKLECIDRSLITKWAVITKQLTPKEAIEAYGPVSNLELGPRGGFRSVTYGDKKFLSRELDPRP